MPALTRPQKITFAEMRAAGVRGILVYCSDHRCSHSFDFVIAPSGAGVSSCVYILIMRDSLYYFIALLCVAVVLGWLIFLTLGA
jgi:hypothetical protein